MKKAAFIAVFALTALFAIAQPPTGDAKPGEWYGEKISADNAIDIADIPARLQTKKKLGTKIKAKVLDVCPKMGCWIKLAINDSSSAFVRMKDYGFFLPLAIKGKTVVLEGEAAMKTTSVAALRHYAEDANGSKEEIAAITQPKNEIIFTANGILVVD